MEIYIGKDGQVLGPYYPDEIQKRLDGDVFDGTELACHKGLEAWVNVKELLEGKDEPAPETEEPSVETESAEESEPLDEETLEQVNKIKELISDLTPLKELTQLMSLSLRGNQISESDKQDLQEALPDCNISY